MPKLVSADLDLQGVARLLNVPTPANPGDAVPKSYADGLIGGGATDAFVALTADYAILNQTAAQKLFNATPNGALTLQTGVYAFDAMIYLTGMSATTGNGVFALKGAGTATLARILQQAVGADNLGSVNGQGFAQSGQLATGEAFTLNMFVNATTAGMYGSIRGLFDVTAAGTIIPSVAQTTASAAVVKAGSYFSCRRLGPTGTVTQGAWS